MSFAIYTHPDCLLHDTGPDHPETSDRLASIVSVLEAAQFPMIIGKKATSEQLYRAHTKDYVDSVPSRMPKSGIGYIDQYSPVSPQSLDAALVAAGTVCMAVDDVMAGTIERAFCAVRPPGHHAISSTSMGFCIFNNLAVAAAHALEHHGLKRVAIIDWDVHHGNGTQEIFGGKDDRVLFISLQENGMWPADEDCARTEGNVMNFLMDVDAPASDYHKAFAEHILPALERFQPEMIFISAGFDSHQLDRFAPPTTFNDPPGKQNLTAEDYASLTASLRECAEKWACGRLISVLEGGYNIPVLADAVLHHVQDLNKELTALAKPVFRKAC